MAGGLRILGGGGTGGAGTPGPKGDAGEPGQPRYVGDGPPPATIPGARPGDRYVDELTGTVYTLR